jgi:RND family efflux transporter MFP subunit
MSKRSIIAALLAFIVVVGGLAAIQHFRPKLKPVLTQSSIQKEAGVPVVVGAVTKETVSDALSVTGQIAADSTTSLSTKVAGKVLFVAAREGDTVSAGEVVIQLDDADARRQLEAAQASFQQAEAGLLQAQTRLSQARTGQTVGDVQAASAYDAAKAAVKAAKARLDMVVTGARHQERLQAQNAVASAKASEVKAESDYRRYKALTDEGAVSASTLDGYKTALDVAKAQYDSAVQAESLVNEGSRSEDIRQAQAAVEQANEQLRSAQINRKTNLNRREDVLAASAGVVNAKAAVAAAQANVGIAAQNVDNFKIRAPRAGAVTARSVEPGQYANPGQGLLTIVDLSTVYVQADVSEVDVQRVRPGMAVDVTVDAMGDREWRGRVTSVVASADPASRSFTVKVAIGNEDRALRPNMFARAEITTGRIVDATLVPKEAVFQRDGRDRVVRVRNGKASLVPVSTGTTVGELIVVRSAGLGLSDKVVTTGQQDLTDGQKVSVDSGR